MDSPGRTRQLIVACAFCGKALSASPCFQQCRDTCGANLRIVRGQGGKPRYCGRVWASRGDGEHVGADLLVLEAGSFFKPGAGRRVEPDRKIELSKTAEPSGQMIDGIVFGRNRTMSAGDFSLQGRIVHRHFLTCLNVVAEGLAISQAHASSFVERELRIDQIPMVLDEPLHAHAVPVENLFICFERQNSVAIGPGNLPACTESELKPNVAAMNLSSPLPRP